MSQAPSARRKLPIAAELAIDACCGRFEEAWLAGDVPDLRTVLDEADLSGDADARRALLIELVLIDLEYRWRAAGDGDASAKPRLSRLLVEDYLPEWPELLDDAGTPPVEIVRQEFRLRRLTGETPKIAEYLARFPLLAGLDESLTVVERRTPEWMRSMRGSTRPGESQAASTGLSVRCPHCRDAVTVVADSALADIACSECGQTFSLVGDDRKDEAAPPLAAIAHFEFLERLGVGGFGTVWRARDTRLDRLVAVKIPRKSDLNSAEAQQFLREARAAAQLKHPNIVRVHEVGREGDTIFIVSDYIRGQPLSKRLETGALSQRDAAALAAKLADALAHAHAAGIVHRDLKPANIMLDEAGEPHVMDFGLAKRDAGEMTMTFEGHILGTPAYMPPEQARGQGHDADARSDVYSLGVILFEMLTGELPFRGSTQMLIAQILGEEPPSPRKLDRNLSRDLETITLKCLEKEPAQRYGTALGLGEELRRYLHGEPIHARPVSRVERAWRWCKRRPLVAGLGGTLTLLVLAVAIVAPIVAARQSQLRENAEDLAGDLDVSLGEQRKQTDTANRLRGEAEQLNISLKQAIAEKDRQFRTANTLRLAAQAKTLVDDAPQRSVLLAAAAVEKSKDLVETQVEAQQALYDVLALVSGIGLSGHEAPITAVSAAPNGKWFVSGDRKGRVVLWNFGRDNVATSREMARFDRDIIGIECLADSRRVVVAASNGAIRAFDIAGEDPNKPVSSFDNEAGIKDIAISSQNAVAAAGDDGHVRLWKLDETESNPAIDIACGTKPLRTVACDGESRMVAAAGDEGMVYVCDLTKPDAKPLTLVGSGNVVQLLRFSPDARWLASSGNDSDVRLWPIPRSLEDGSAEIVPVVLAGHGDAVRDVTFSDDGKQVATAGSSDAIVRVWRQDGVGWTLFRSLAGHKSIVRSVLFSDDGQRLVSGSEDRMVRVWKLDAEQVERTSLVLRGHELGVNVLASLGGGRLISGGNDGMLRVYDNIETIGASSTSRKRLPAPVQAVCILGDGGKRIAINCADGNVYVWSQETGSLLGPFGESKAGGGTQLAASRDGSLLAVAAADGSVVLWRTAELAEGEKRPVPRIGNHDGPASGVAFAPDGRRFFTVSHDGSLRAWHVAGDGPLVGDIVREGRRPLVAMAIAPDGRWAATGDQRGPIEFTSLVPADSKGTSPGSQRVPRNLLLRSLATSIAVSPNGKRLYAGDFQGAIRRFDLDRPGGAASQESFRGHDKAVMSLAISGDGKLLLSTSHDGTARLWDLSADHSAATGVVLRGHFGPVFAGAIRGDGKAAVTGCGDGFVRVWAVSSSDLLSHARRVAGREFSAEERVNYQIEVPVKK